MKRIDHVDYATYNAAKNNVCNHYLYSCLIFQNVASSTGLGKPVRPAVPFSFSADGQNPPMNLQRLPKLVSQAIGGIP